MTLWQRTCAVLQNILMLAIMSLTAQYGYWEDPGEFQLFNTAIKWWRGVTTAAVLGVVQMIHADKLFSLAVFATLIIKMQFKSHQLLDYF